MRNLLCVGLVIATGGCDKGFKDDNPDADQVVQGWDSCLQAGGNIELFGQIDNNAVTDHGTILTIDVSADNQVAVASSDGSLKFWTVEHNGSIQSETYNAAFEVGTPPKLAIAYSSDGLLSTGDENGALWRMDPESGASLDSRAHGDDAIRSLAFNESEQLLAVGDANFGGNVRVHAMQSSDSTVVQSRLWGLGAVMWHNGDLYTAGDDYGIVAIERWTGDQWQESAESWIFLEEALAGHIRDLAASASGDIFGVGNGDIAIEGHDGVLVKIPSSDYMEPLIVELAGHSPLTMTLTPAGGYFLTADPNGIRAWSSSNLSEQARLDLSQVIGARMLPNGLLLVAQETGQLLTYQCQ